MKQMNQKDFAFVPPLLPVQTGTAVEFPNLDDTYHNIFSYSPTKRFDLGRYRPEERPIPSVLFDVPGLVTLRCDIHEHMRGLRSEEHTSELQSRENLVCRLLLEK